MWSGDASLIAEKLNLRSAVNVSQQIRRFALGQEERLPPRIREWEKSRNVAWARPLCGSGSVERYCCEFSAEITNKRFVMPWHGAWQAPHFVEKADFRSFLDPPPFSEGANHCRLYSTDHAGASGDARIRRQGNPRERIAQIFPIGSAERSKLISSGAIAPPETIKVMASSRVQFVEMSLATGTISR